MGVGTTFNLDTYKDILTVAPFGGSYIGGMDISGSASGTGNNYINNVYISGNYEYVVTGGNDTAGGGSACATATPIGCEFQIYDISKPASPVFVGGADASGVNSVTGTGNSGNGGTDELRAVVVVGHYAYITKALNANTCGTTTGNAALGCELQIYDISNPAAPVYVGGVDGSGQTNTGTYASHGFEYNIAYSNGYLYVPLGGLNTTNCNNNITGNGGVGAGGCEIQIYNLHNPAVPSFVTGIDSSGITGATGTGAAKDTAWDVVVSGRYLYVTLSRDAANATACSAAGVTPANGCDLQIYDISNPSSPVYKGGADWNGNTNSGPATTGDSFGQVVVQGNYAYVTKSGNAGACTAAGTAAGCEVQIYNVSNPSAPTFVGGADASGVANGSGGTVNNTSNGMVVSGHYMYVTYNGSATACSNVPGSAVGCELQVYDVSNPSSPAYKGGADVSGSTNSGTTNSGDANMAISGRNLYVSQGGNSATTCAQTPGNAIGCELQIYDTGGADVAGLNAGSIETSQLQVDQNTTIKGDLTVLGNANFYQGVRILTSGAGSVGLSIDDATTGINLLQVKDLNTNFGSAVTGGAFISRNAYWGEEYSAIQQNNTAITGTAAAVTCSWDRGDSGGHVVNGAALSACSPTANSNTGSGELSLSQNAGNTGDTCTPSQPTGANSVIGIERIAEVTPVTANTGACMEYLTGAGGAGALGYPVAAGNLPVGVFKVKPSTLTSANTNQIFVGFYGQGATAGAPNTIPGTAASTGGVYFTNCTATTPTCTNTSWNGWVVNASGTLVGNVACPGTLSTSNFAYLRIEFRSATEVHFYIDVNTSDGVTETECGDGVNSGSVPTLAMSPFFMTRTTAASTTVALDLDYMRVWSDDNVDLSSSSDSSSSDTTTSPVTTTDNSLNTTAPLTPDPNQPDPNVEGSFFNFNGATSEDTVFNNNVFIHGTLYVNKIEANEIDGLSIFTDQLASLQQRLNEATSTTTNPNSTTTNNTIIQTATTTLNLSDGLTVGGDASFHGNVFFYKLVTFTEKTLFNNDVTFAAHITTDGAAPTYNLESAVGTTNDSATIDGNDNSGSLNITAGDNPGTGKMITVNFANPYAKAPHVVISATNDQAANIHYYVQSTPTGFVIYVTDTLNPGANLTFNYFVIQ